MSYGSTLAYMQDIPGHIHQRSFQLQYNSAVALYAFINRLSNNFVLPVDSTECIDKHGFIKTLNTKHVKENC